MVLHQIVCNAEVDKLRNKICRREINELCSFHIIFLKTSYVFPCTENERQFGPAIDFDVFSRQYTYFHFPCSTFTKQCIFFITTRRVLFWPDNEFPCMFAIICLFGIFRVEIVQNRVCFLLHRERVPFLPDGNYFTRISYTNILELHEYLSAHA